MVQRHRAGEGADRALGGRVGGDAGLGRRRLHGGDGDDRAAAPRAQRGQGVAGEQVDRAHVDAEHLVPGVGRGVLDRPVALDPGAADEHVEAAERLDGAVHQRLGVPLVAEVAVQAVGARAGGGQLVHGRPHRPRVVAADQHRRSLAREPRRGGPPDPERAAGDQRDLAVEAAVVHGTSSGGVTSTKRGRYTRTSSMRSWKAKLLTL
jgi:hypothetical protein